MKKYLLFLIPLLSCQKVVSPSDSFNDAQDLGIIENVQIKEASGIVASYQNKGLLWTHNDSGDSNRIFSIDTKGKGTREFYLEGATNRDWEAIAIAKFTEGSYLYIGEIGDNNAEYATSAIYRVPEPTITSTTPQSNTLKNVQKITYKYPDGARDVECFLIDQVSKDIYIISKRDNLKRLYRLPYPQSYTSTITAEFVQELAFSTGTATPLFITDGNISADNQEIIIKNYLQIFHWRRNTNESIAEALKRTPIMLPYTAEAQGEGICFGEDGAGYYTISEESSNKIPVKLHYYQRK
ncbi:hypothetical protein VB796_04610 [Arcicella sp. LKC2W]|uniref:hypothetical protein n=1 Tax=Arcicella sp. LKC2W TaxID=2984198 RepID=UPI002B1EC105|nr:hypothetical protein [Arcicella sp. LKC2W]MEA5458304.1 hypothetical protein [Arcicella sp. LKC2W]